MTSAATVTSAPFPKAASGPGLLRASALTWWWVTLIGQWAFLYYLVGFYGTSTLAGHISDWNRNHMLLKGYVAGQHAWNFNFGMHVLLAAVIAFGGAVQMVPQIRQRAAWFHRWNGRIFMLTALAGAFTGLWMTWAGGTGISGGATGDLAVSLNAMLIITFAAVAWAFVRAGRMDLHRRWALRLFMVANGVWFLRLGIFSWYILTRGAGMSEHMDGPADVAFSFASYLVPLAVLELYLRARDGRSVVGKTVTASILFAGTAYMSLGIFALSMVEWRLVRLF